MKKLSNLIVFLAFIVLGFGGGIARANTVTIGGGLNDGWGISDPAQGLVDKSAWPLVNNITQTTTGYMGGVWYWEEQSAHNDWGYVSPGYGGYAYQIKGLYFTYDANNLYFAAVVGMPPGGVDGGYWNGTAWATWEHNTMGDIALSFGGTNFNYGIETLGTNAGDLYQVSNWTGTTDYPGSAPANIAAGTDLGKNGFVYEPLAGTNPSLYYIEAEIKKPDTFDVSKLTIHLTETCGNDVADLRPSPVPEPGTLALLGSGLACMAFYRRRRKNG